MKILILGADGMLGHKLVQVLGEGLETWAAIRSSSISFPWPSFANSDRMILDLDVRDISKLETVLKDLVPDVVINSVGIVKQKESSGVVPEMLEINSLLPHRVARLAADLNFRLITISTDCVFSGTKGNYSENDIPDSLDLYGQSKHWGEIEDQANCLTIRTSIIGREIKTGHGLAEWFISRRGSRVEGFSRAVFSGFPTIVFADIIVDIIENHTALSGVFHVSSDPITKFDLLTKINASLDLGIKLIESESLVIDRSLDSSKFRNITGFEPQSWDIMIARFALDSQNYDR